MNIIDLVDLDKRYRAEKPALFNLSKADQLATNAMIETVEKHLKFLLPETYKSFLRIFGGGNYGLTVIFSADEKSEWYLPRMQAEAERYVPKGFLAFSDDFSGGYYVLSINDGSVEDCVMYWSIDCGISSTQYSDIIEFVSRFAYEPA
jgi:hypothetical protein